MVRGVGLGSPPSPMVRDTVFGVTAPVRFNPLALCSGWHLYPCRRRPRCLVVCLCWVHCCPHCRSLRQGCVALVAFRYAGIEWPSLSIAAGNTLISHRAGWNGDGCWYRVGGSLRRRGIQALMLVTFRLHGVHLSSPSCYGEGGVRDVSGGRMGGEIGGNEP